MPGDRVQEAAYRTADLALFHSGRFADVVVTCGPKSWNLHKNILCTRSVWFEKALAGDYVAAQQRAEGEEFDGDIRIHEQDPDAVGVCLKYIYGGVAAINMVQEKKFRPTFKFCAELYRSVDFFLLKPLLPVIQRHLGDYCDEKIRWLHTRGNVINDLIEKKALIWVEDLKDAICEVEQWKTPVIREMLMEFVWAGKSFLNCSWNFYMSIQDWLYHNFPRFWYDMNDHCDPCGPGQWGSRMGNSPTEFAVWAPAQCQLPIPEDWQDHCVRCGNELQRHNICDFIKMDEGQLKDPFNLPSSRRITREWCRACADEVKYPWREHGYF